MLKIDEQLRAQWEHKTPCTVKTLTDALEVNERTVRRLIEMLRDELDAPIEYDRGEQTYKYTNLTWAVPNVRMDEAQMQVLATAVQAIRPVLPASMSMRLDKLLASLLDALPVSSRKNIRRTQGQVEFVPAPVMARGAEWFELLHDAIFRQRSVDMTYYLPARDAETQRRFDPYYLRNVQGAWYVIGYDHTVKHWPILKLARIRTLTLSDTFYEKQKFSATEYFKNSLGIMVDGKTQPVRIRLTGYAVITADEQIWPSGFTYQRKSPQEGILSGRVTSMGDLIPWVASFQGDAEILPEE